MVIDSGAIHRSPVVRRSPVVWPRTLRGFALLVAVSTAVSCVAFEQDTLVVADSIPLSADSASTLHVDPTGDLWIGAPGELIRLDGRGTERRRFGSDGVEAPTFIGTSKGRLYFRTSSSLLMVDPVTDSLIVARVDGADAGAADPRGGYILRSRGAGAVVAHDTERLDAIWGWGAVGAPSHAIAISPQGDRVYQAVEKVADGSAGLLVRDAFTGRVLRTKALPEPAEEVLIDAGGGLYVLGWTEDGGGGVEGLVWEEGELRTSWRRTLGDIGLEAPLRMVYSFAGEKLALLALNDPTGLRIVDGKTGQTTERLRGEIRDLDFDVAGRLFVLYPDAVHRME